MGPTGLKIGEKRRPIDAEARLRAGPEEGDRIDRIRDPSERRVCLGSNLHGEHADRVVAEPSAPLHPRGHRQSQAAGIGVRKFQHRFDVERAHEALQWQLADDGTRQLPGERGEVGETPLGRGAPGEARGRRQPALQQQAAGLSRSGPGLRRPGERLAEEKRRRVVQDGPAVRTLRGKADLRPHPEFAIPGAPIAAGLLAGAPLRLGGGLPTDRLARDEQQTEEASGEHHSTTTASPVCSRNSLARPRPRDSDSKVKRMRVSCAWRRSTKIRSR